jgi:two-component system NarL family sensor kinase
MARRVVNAQEEERIRISRELHDDLGQALIAHLLGLRSLQMESPIAEGVLRQRLDTLITETHQTLDKMRLLAQDLRPTVLDTLGLKSALETHCQEFSSRTNLPVSLQVDADLPDLSDVYSITLYRFLQETLTNVIKHSDARQIWVELFIDEQEIVLSVQDNGSGFSEKDASAQNGIGIPGLRERLIIVGGELTINSSSNGTIISAHLPHEEKAPSVKAV